MKTIMLLLAFCFACAMPAQVTLEQVRSADKAADLAADRMKDANEVSYMAGLKAYEAKKAYEAALFGRVSEDTVKKAFAAMKAADKAAEKAWVAADAAKQEYRRNMEKRLVLKRQYESQLVGEVADPWAVCRKERTWRHKKMADGMTITTTIKNVTDKGCVRVTQLFGADGKEMYADSHTVEFAVLPLRRDVTAFQKVKVAAGEFDCISYNDGKTWVMQKYPQVVVKNEAVELIEFQD